MESRQDSGGMGQRFRQSSVAPPSKTRLWDRQIPENGHARSKNTGLDPPTPTAQPANAGSQTSSPSNTTPAPDNCNAGQFAEILKGSDCIYPRRIRCS